MIDYELEQLLENIEWQCVLYAYAEDITLAVIANPEHVGWVERLQDVPHVEQEHLARIHGKLIALGFLKFELGDRHAGVQYQLSQAGKRALNSLAPTLQADAA